MAGFCIVQIYFHGYMNYNHGMVKYVKCIMLLSVLGGACRLSFHAPFIEKYDTGRRALTDCKQL